MIILNFNINLIYSISSNNYPFLKNQVKIQSNSKVHLDKIKEKFKCIADETIIKNTPIFASKNSDGICF
jgi:hypothetical protein